MSYGIMGGARTSHILTYQTTREVKCIYFDGESATLFGTGQMQSQMLHIWGNVSGPGKPDNGFRGLWEEYARAAGLCDWIRDKKLGGPGWGFEGIVRMNAGFEMIWCNFSSPSIRLISHLNVTAPLLGAPDQDVAVMGGDPTSYYPLPTTNTGKSIATDPAEPARPPTMGGSIEREPFTNARGAAWYLSAVAHYGSSANGPGLGEIRVKPATCGFQSYYSSKYQSAAIPRAEAERQYLNLSSLGLWSGPGTSGNRSRALDILTRRRRNHTLDHVSEFDAAIFRADSERVLKDLLSSTPANCTGIDWSAITNEIVQTYAHPLLVFSKTLQQYSSVTKNNQTMIRNWMSGVRQQSHLFLMPFFEYPKTTDKTTWDRSSNLFSGTYSKCRYQQTRLLAPEEGFVLGPEDTEIKNVIETVLGGICSTIVEIGLAIEDTWASKFNNQSPLSDTTYFTVLGYQVTHWHNGIEELMAWLGWAGEWTGCEETCAWDESCYIPMWPMIPMGGGRGRGGGGGRRGGSGYGGGYRRPGFPPNQTYPGPPDRGGPDGRFGSGMDETDLWEPKCVKSDYIMGGSK